MQDKGGSTFFGPHFLRLPSPGVKAQAKENGSNDHADGGHEPSERVLVRGVIKVRRHPIRRLHRRRG